MRFTKTVYSNHPRCYFRDTDETDLRNASNDFTRWKQRWDDDWLPGAQRLESQYTVNELAQNVDNGHLRNMQLAVVAKIDNNATLRAKCIDVAVALANNYLGLYTRTDRRYAIACMVAALDIHYSSLTAGQKSDIVDGINTMCSSINAGLDWDTRFDGHSPGNAAFMMMGGLAIDGDHASSSTYINNGLDFWYGATADGEGTVYFYRYYGATGGHGKGGSYSTLAHWYTLQYLRWIHNGFVRNEDTPNSLQLDGAEYAPWDDEDWVQSSAEWFLHNLKGNDDRLQIADCSRSNPWFHYNWREVVTMLATHGGTWRPQMKWLYDRLHEKDAEGNYNPGTAYYTVHDFFNMDPGDPDNAAQTPDDAGVPRAKFFYPPGLYSLRHPVFDPRQSCQIVATLEDRYFHGHTHLKVGGIQIDVGADAVLLNSGYYDDYQTDHMNNWGQQSISCSGVPLVEGVGTSDTEHYNRNEAGTRTTYTIAEGGQCWMSSDGTINGDFGPDNAYDLQYAGSGLAWKRADDTRMVHTDTNYDFVYCDFRRAYLKTSGDYDTSAERVKGCELKMVVIKDVGPWPIVFRALRVESRLASMVKRDHWHFHTAPAWEADASEGKFRGYGYNGTAYCSVHYYRPGDFTFQTVGGGAVVNGYGQYDFYWPYPGGANHPPNESAGSRYQPYVGHYRMEVRPNTAEVENWFVCLLMPGNNADVLPSYEWLDELNYWGVKFGSTEYRISKDAVQAIRGAQDTTPPDPPTGVAAASGPSSGEVTVSHLPNTDDAYLYRYYYRVQ